MMESGRIVKWDIHNQLISTGGAYTALYNSQFAGTDTPAAELQPGQDQLTVTQ